MSLAEARNEFRNELEALVQIVAEERENNPQKIIDALLATYSHAVGYLTSLIDAIICKEVTT